MSSGLSLASVITGGVVAYRARQLDRTGTLMTAIGVIWNLDSVVLYVHALLPYAAWLGGLVDPLLAQLLLSYPSRAVRSRLERAVLAAAYLQVLVVNGVREVFVNLHDYYPCPCVHSFPTVHNPPVFRALEIEARLAIVVLGTAILALVFRRWRRSSGPARRALNPLWFAGLATLTALILEAVRGFARLTPAHSTHPGPGPGPLPGTGACGQMLTGTPSPGPLTAVTDGWSPVHAGQGRAGQGRRGHRARVTCWVWHRRLAPRPPHDPLTLKKSGLRGLFSRPTAK